MSFSELLCKPVHLWVLPLFEKTIYDLCTILLWLIYFAPFSKMAPSISYCTVLNNAPGCYVQQSLPILIMYWPNLCPRHHCTSTFSAHLFMFDCYHQLRNCMWLMLIYIAPLSKMALSIFSLFPSLCAARHHVREHVTAILPFKTSVSTSSSSAGKYLPHSSKFIRPCPVVKL